MSRKIASALIAFFLLPYFWPLLQQNSDSSLPLCCRRDGKHHCAMMTRLHTSDWTKQQAVRTWNSDCPYRAALQASPKPRAATLCPPKPLHIRLFSHPAGFVQAELSARISEARSHYKRGPPSVS
jgi:hypothetical protein